MTHRAGARAAGWAWTLAALGAMPCVAQVNAGPVGAPGPEGGVYVHAQAEAWSNGLPVTDLDGDWRRGYQRRKGPQRAYASARLETGAWLAGAGASGRPRLRLGAVQRLDATAVMSGDAAEVLRLYQRGQDPDQPATYDATTRMRHWRGAGVAWHADWPLVQGVRLSLSGDLLQLQRLRVLHTQGSVAYQADGSYAYAGRLRDDDSRYQALFMGAPEARGQGLTGSLGAEFTPAAWGLGAGWPDRMSLRLEDAWSRLVWDGVNGHDAVLDSQVQTRDPDGRVAYRAAIQGRYTQRQLVSDIPMRSQLQLDWTLPSGQWSLQVVERIGLWQRWVSWQGPWAVQPTLAVDPVARAWSAGLQWGGLSLHYAAGLGEADARIRSVQLRLQSALWGGEPR